MNLNHACHYLKMKVKYDYDKQQICLNQKTYIEQLLQYFDMQNCILTLIFMLQKLVITDKLSDYIKADFIINNYQSVIESLQFLANYICAEISFTAEFLAR